MLPGVDNFYDALEDMLGYRPNPWMKWSWTVITPLLCVVRVCVKTWLAPVGEQDCKSLPETVKLEKHAVVG